MKKLMTLLCLLCFAGCAYAEVYEIPGSRVETTSEVQVQQDGSKQVTETKVKRRRLLRHRDQNPTNTYWNFGKVPFWTGSI
ncbi:hypothetical protein BHV42_06530 [Candidatus Melainabacteria bacterium MEL.A1]|jgi:hypothetical protein|nr:hypothetical protein BHV42_06530 [Candidatus Melainabacteria bacterium MEL.A1]CCX79832.1 unknown [Clostridium sp. CAG:715]DAA86190.1 MAG TPA: hypothetical protein CPT82_02625 [Candidatus Gastranaerophilales bacterium HUM_2]